MSPAKVKVKRKQWSEESMLAAMMAVRDGTPIYRAAKLHGVPRSTLHDRISGKVKHGTKPGPKPYLSNAEETELSNFLVDVAKAGYGKSRKQVIAIAESVAKDKGVLKKEKRISEGWYRRFMERQSYLALRKGDATANVRMDCLNEETIQAYFNLLKEVLSENNLMDSPCQIYNVDETGIPLDHRPPKVVTRKGQKKVRSRTTGNKSQITVIGCVNAAGSHIPPFVIFDAKNLNHDWTDGEVPGTTYGTSQKGWVDTELFKVWLTDHFLQFAVSARPLLLLLDGHSSHFQPELIHYAKDHDIIVFCLPPHTTHESQPLDASVFRSLKQHWQEVAHSYMESNPGKLITKYNFSPLLNQAWSKTMTPSTICSGFRRCGVYPFNPKAIDCQLTAEKDEGSKGCEGQSKPSEDGNGDHEDHGESDDHGRRKSDEFNRYVPEDLHLDPDTNQIDSKKEELFQRRFEEGYDIYDSEYLEWLERNHPVSVPADRYTLVSASEQQPSISDFFSNITPMQAVDLDDELSRELNNTNSRAATPQPSGQDTDSNATMVTAALIPSSIVDSVSKSPGVSTISDPSTAPKSPELHITQKPSDLMTMPKHPKTSGEVKRSGTSGLIESAATHISLGPNKLPYPLGQATTPNPPGVDTRMMPEHAGVFVTPKRVGPAATSKPPGVATTPLSSAESPGMAAVQLKTPVPNSNNSTPMSTCSRVLTSGSVTNTPSSTTPSSDDQSPANGDPKGELKYISKYLVQYVPSTTPKPKESSSSKRVSGARILTSAQCLNMIQEREDKKKKLLEEKEQRKLEREQKRAEKEAAAKKRAEEKAKKAELAAKQREARSKKRQKPRLSSNVATKKQKTAENSSTPSSSTSVDGPSKSTSRRKTTLRSQQSSVTSVRANVEERSQDAENIDINRCCVCFGTFQEDQELGTGFEWLECACKRWLHEVCVSDIEINADGKELLCPFCCI